MTPQNIKEIKQEQIKKIKRMKHTQRQQHQHENSTTLPKYANRRQVGVIVVQMPTTTKGKINQQSGVAETY